MARNVYGTAGFSAGAARITETQSHRVVRVQHTGTEATRANFKRLWGLRPCRFVRRACAVPGRAARLRRNTVASLCTFPHERRHHRPERLGEPGVAFVEAVGGLGV